MRYSTYISLLKKLYLGPFKRTHSGKILIFAKIFDCKVRNLLVNVVNECANTDSAKSQTKRTHFFRKYLREIKIF